MEYRILGPLEVLDDGRPVPLGGAKQRALLTILLVHAGEAVSRDHLVEELWSGNPPETAATALQVHVSQLRKALGTHAAGAAPRIATRPPGYALVLDGDELDLARFDGLVREGRAALASGRPDDAAAALAGALALWRGPPLAELAATAEAELERARLADARLAATEDWVEAKLQLGEYGDVVGELESLVRANPLRERLLGQLMLALYRSGRQADALEAYRRGRRLLAEELGLDPGEELRRLERAILQHDRSLDAPPRPAVRRLSDAARRRNVLLIAAGALAVAGAAAGLALALTGGASPARASVLPDSVAAVDARSGRVVADVPVGGRPVGLAVGAGGVWVANGDDGTLLHVDPGSHRVVKTIGLGADVDSVAVGFGSVWVAGGNDETLIRVDPERDAVEAVLRFGESDPLHPRPVFFVATGERAIWITRGRRLLGVDPATSDVVADVRIPTPIDLAAGGGDVWVTTETEELIRVAEASGQITARSRLPFFGVSPVVLGDSVWLIVFTDTPQLWRMNRDDLTQTAAVPFRSGFPFRLTATGGELWVVDHARGTVSSVGRDGRLARPTLLGQHPISSAAGSGLVWVGVQRDPFS